jgi:small subunit ribosomal protein S4
LARYTGPVCKLCRNEEQKLFLKGERCYSNKCSVAKRPYGSGQHGQSRKKLSEYALHLREKQKVRNSYLVLEKQFARYFQEAERKAGVTGTTLLQLLELRFDNVLYKAGIIPSRKQARQLIRHRHFLINGRTVDIPSYRLKKEDEISVKASSEKTIKVIVEAESLSVAGPRWMTIDKDKIKVRVDSIPDREDIDPNIKEHLIIEYYSK